jgi:hypothetical protein
MVITNPTTNTTFFLTFSIAASPSALAALSFLANSRRASAIASFFVPSARL